MIGIVILRIDLDSDNDCEDTTVLAVSVGDDARQKADTFVAAAAAQCQTYEKRDPFDGRKMVQWPKFALREVEVLS